MLNLNSVLVMVFIVLGAGTGHIMKEKNAGVTSQVTDSLFTTTFLLYADTLSTFKKNHPAYTGTVSAHGLLPPWLGKKPEIMMKMDSGIGYVYMPNKSRLYAGLMSATDHSSLMGVTDEHHLITLSGQIPKPPFIPENHLVYMR
ncbi:type IV pilus biogenesis protein PilM [Candidatus Williamhamiltonella defendens]|uniref:type IV pilus biogenesis protein PilM n=1 Tax=Candidatus Williamhamiltonella defendens TaxID=138072 RepID=UPI00031A5A33|nr:type IV pilus biogenesis protein PilM [Candidatus Hamiltonella defensa]